MKDYKNVAEDVFRRSGEVIEENKRRRKKFIEIGVSAACWAAAGAVGFGVWKSSEMRVPDTVISAGQFANDGKDHSGESDVVLIDPAKGGNDPVRGGVTAPANSQGSPSGEESSRPATYPEIDENDIDWRCYPVIHLPAQTYHTCINSYDIDSEGRYAGIPELVGYGHRVGTGDVFFSSELIEALAKYGKTDEYGEILYDIIIYHFKNGEWVEPTIELWESELDKFGSGFFFETDSDGTHYMGISSATYDMLHNFARSEEYGYKVSLRGDVFEDPNSNSNSRLYSHGDHTASFESLGIDYCKPRGRISNINVDVEEPEYAPENGTALLSESLKKAVEIYGKEDKNGELDYRVIIEYYKDGKRIDSTKELWESESEKGARNNFESHGSDFGQTWEHYIWDYMTVDDLESFAPSGEYGCVIYLYSAYFGYPYKYDDNIINGLYNNGVYFE